MVFELGYYWARPLVKDKFNVGIQPIQIMDVLSSGHQAVLCFNGNSDTSDWEVINRIPECNGESNGDPMECPNGCGPMKYLRMQYLVGGRRARYYVCLTCHAERRDIEAQEQ